jgi:putative MATE family efflux protein
MAGFFVINRMSEPGNDILQAPVMGLNGENSRLKRLLSDLREALTGTARDFTTGSVGRAVLLLSVPMVLEMVMESVFAIVDIFFVSRLGADAVAVVGITESIMTIVYSIGMGLGTATAAMVARRSGEKNPEGASLAAAHGILLALSASFLIAVPGIFFSKELLILMGTTESVAESYYLYPAIMLSGNVVIMLLFMINAIFRSSGDAALSMKVLWFANIANIILDPLFIFGFGPIPALGIKGAAIATTVGRGMAVAYQVWTLTGNGSRVKLQLRHFLPSAAILVRLLKLSAGGIGQMLIATASWIVMVRLIALFGSEILAGYTIALRIMLFSLLPSWGLSNAAATLVGQNLGAGQPERAVSSVWLTAMINLAFLGIAGTVFMSFPSFFIGLFISDPGVVEAGAQCLRIISIGFVFYAFGMVMIQAFNGAGDTRTPTWLNLFFFWLVEIPLAWVLAINAGLNETGVYLAIVIAESSIALAGIILFRRGSWKQQKV